MMIETERTQLMPFTIELIDAAYSKNYSKLESIGIAANQEWPEPDLLEALPVFRNLILENGINGFNSWIIKDKKTNEVIGSLGFLGNPDEKGNVEIGFGIIPSKRNKGYCIETVKELIIWVKKQKGVQCIKAQCERTNEGSKKILYKLGFGEKQEQNGLMNWEMKITEY
jgi:[ribosomal protein S5]-alanine N-acetyltransferase